MKKSMIFGFLLAAALLGTSAFAAQNVANTSQKGSLLVFPLIDIRSEDKATTQIEISNDQNAPVHVECEYVNTFKGRRDFDFFLSPKQTVSWDVLTHTGEGMTPSNFPNDGNFPGLGNTDGEDVGELICFAVDAARSAQVRFNHLIGNATVVYFDDSDTFNQTTQAFKYNAWSFTARSALVPPPPDNTPVGVPGTMLLTGGGDGTYDACPAYLIANFSPGGTFGQPQPPRLGGVTTLDSELSVSICNQDLRQDFLPHITKLHFTVWNVFESSFTGTFICSDSTGDFNLNTQDFSPLPAFSGGGAAGIENFGFPVVQTRNARFEVEGVASSQCIVFFPEDTGIPPIFSESTGLLGVLRLSIQIAGDTGDESAEVGSTLYGAGLETGFVLWDPAGPVPEKNRRRR